MPSMILAALWDLMASSEVIALHLTQLDLEWPWTCNLLQQIQFKEIENRNCHKSGFFQAK